MVSEKLALNTEPQSLAAARRAGEAFGREMGLSGRSALRLTLLVEETLGMVRAMVEDFYGQIWFVSRGSVCEIHLQATADLDPGRKYDLLSLSTTGHNAAHKGFMGRLGDFFSNFAYGVGRIMENYGRETMRYGIIHSDATSSPALYEVTPVWSLRTYRRDLENESEEGGLAEEARDELERSIVASLADDVIVGIRDDRLELVIVTNLA
ncbi:MAG: hypothetical protein IJH78_09630 [Clostridia bacterium]|nr:hypothetical protein [Clostridia bacterium]